MAEQFADRLQLEKLSPLGNWIYHTGMKYNIINTTLVALNVDPEPEVDHLTGDRYLDFSLCLLFAILFPMARALIRRFVSEVRPTACSRTGPRSFTCCGHSLPVACTSPMCTAPVCLAQHALESGQRFIQG